jgi:hypothetical protein
LDLVLAAALAARTVLRLVAAFVFRTGVVVFTCTDGFRCFGVLGDFLDVVGARAAANLVPSVVVAVTLVVAVVARCVRASVVRMAIVGVAVCVAVMSMALLRRCWFMGGVFVWCMLVGRVLVLVRLSMASWLCWPAA